MNVAVGLSSELMAQQRSMALVGAMVGSKVWNTWAVGHKPGHPRGFSAPVPMPLSLRLPAFAGTLESPAALRWSFCWSDSCG